MHLNNAKIKTLRGLTHDLAPVVIVADKGLTENVCTEIESALRTHELIKIKLRAERDQRTRWTEEIVAKTGAELIQKIGQVISIFRRNPEAPKIQI